MPYIVDRQQAFRDTEFVAVVSIRQRGTRSRVFLRNGSLYHTLTRPRTLRRNLNSLSTYLRRQTG